MSSEAITQNDLREILSRTVGSIPSEYKKLLWTNSQGAQSSYSFSADFSNYDEIEIVFKRAGDLITKRMGNSGSATFRIVWANYIVERTATISNGTMTIGNGGFYGSYNAGSLTAGATYAVPTYVYGIKYERVAPPQVEYTNYSTEEQEVGTFIDGKTIYRKSKLYTWSGTTTYDADFFQGISVDRIVRQRTQITKNANYAQEGFYWTSSDYNRCWISLINNPPIVSFSCSQSAGCEILITVDYTKA